MPEGTVIGREWLGFAPVQFGLPLRSRQALSDRLPNHATKIVARLAAARILSRLACLFEEKPAASKLFAGLPTVKPRARWYTTLEARLITIRLNGEPRGIPEDLTLAALLEWLKLSADRVAVERNSQIVPRDRWHETPVQAGDRLEVVHFVGGGSYNFGL